MPKYRVLEQSFIGNTLVEAGVEIEYAGVPGANLEPIDAAAEKAAAKAAKLGGVSVPSSADAEALAVAREAQAAAEAATKEATDKAEALAKELEETKAALAKFDKDGDGKAGGSKPKSDPALA